MQHFGCGGLGLMPLVPLSVVLVPIACAAIDVPEARFRWLPFGILVAVLGLWLVGGAMFHRFGGRLGAGALLGYAFSQACLCMMALLAAGLAVGLALAALAVLSTGRL